ncbi:MAG: dTDP-4-amino-4,6-dideoxygalactose transaminase [Gammaproteobacteria bacterium]|nr:dTDP-4-amino-4,6-dideoxygalactose transaminase [Gammaproteobacteria bacterium]
MNPIPFNRPTIVGNELAHIQEAISRGNISGDGHFTRECCALLERRFGIHKVLLTTSCTSALELIAWLYELGPGQEVIMPSYTFVSTANAFLRTGAIPRFVDIDPETLNLDPAAVADAVNENTAAICAVHYAGVGADMDALLALGARHKLRVLEDAAQGVHAWYRGRALGSIAPLAAYSFHATKNYTCGEGGALCINDDELALRAEILREKGTNRTQFIRGEVDKYTWVDVGSSYVPSELTSAFLFGQLERMDEIDERRREIYDTYTTGLEPLAAAGHLRLPVVPTDRVVNHHMFYVLTRDAGTRNALMDHLREEQIQATFHYLPLHTSPMGQQLGYRDGQFPVTEDLSARLLRLPFFHELLESDQQRVIKAVRRFFRD